MIDQTQVEALMRLQDILSELDDLGNEAAGIMRDHFPSAYQTGDAYGVFSFGSSGNRYDTTLASLVVDIENDYEELEEEY